MRDHDYVEIAQRVAAIAANISKDEQADADVFIEFFEWAFDIKFARDKREAIQQAILDSKQDVEDVPDNNDPGLYLVKFVKSIPHSLLGSDKNWDNNGVKLVSDMYTARKSEARRAMKGVFSIPEVAECSRIIAAVSRAIDNQHDNFEEDTSLKVEVSKRTEMKRSIRINMIVMVENMCRLNALTVSTILNIK